MRNSNTLWLSFILGAVALCGLSILQKLFTGYQISIQGFLVPFLAGGGFGLLIGIRHEKLIKVNEQLSKEIDKRIYSEEALRESEAKYKDMYENAPDMHFSINAETTEIIACNRAVIRTLGYSEDEIIGHQCLNFYVPESSEYMKSDVLPAFLKTGTINNEELKLKKKDGGIIDVNLRATAVYDGQGRILYSRSVWRDITQRKQLDKQIRLMQYWVENSVDLFFWVREDSKVLYVNKSVCNSLGYSLEELRSMKVSEFDLGLPLEAWPEFANTLKEKGSHCFESLLRKKDGQIFPVEITANILHFDEKAHFFAYGRDISNRVNAEKKRNELENQLRQTQKMEAIGTLSGGIAHDFNNILSAIIGYTELLRLNLNNNSQEFEYSEQIYQAGNRARDLVKQILTFSRQTEYELTPVKMDTIVKEVSKLLRSSLPTTIEIKKSVQGNSIVMGDPTQIHQILMNLCTNAGHAMQDEGGILTIDLKSVELKGDVIDDRVRLKPGVYVQLSVSDTGHGIPANHLDRIFDPFFTTKKRGQGTGLGLSVVHGIIESFGGSIYVYSEEGQGTTFKIFLPAIERRTEPAKREQEDIPKGSERILFIDDESVLVEMGSTQLASLGYKVTSRSNSLDGLALFKDKPGSFDLVITDMTMPEMTGEKLAKNIKRIRPDIPVILCTGFSSKITPENAEKFDIDALLMKPVILREMATAIRKLLEHQIPSR